MGLGKGDSFLKYGHWNGIYSFNFWGLPPENSPFNLKGTCAWAQMGAVQISWGGSPWHDPEGRNTTPTSNNQLRIWGFGRFAHGFPEIWGSSIKNAWAGISSHVLVHANEIPVHDMVISSHFSATFACLWSYEHSKAGSILNLSVICQLWIYVGSIS